MMLSHERALRLLTLLSNLNIGFHCLLSCMITPREVLSIKRKYCEHLVIHFLSYFPCLNKVTYVKYRSSIIINNHAGFAVIIIFNMIITTTRMCGDLSLDKQTTISRTNMNPTTEEILPEKVFGALRIYFFTPLIFHISLNV